MRPIIYPDRLQFRVTSDVRSAVEQEAERARCAPGEVCRRLIVAALQAQGVKLGQEAEA